MSQQVRLLIICLGNICRSPMVEGALRHRLRQAGLQDQVVVDSAGTGGWHVGQAPDPRAIAIAAANGVDISSFSGRQLKSDDFRQFDWLLCADSSNLREVARRSVAHARARYGLFLPWALGNGEHTEIPDPYTGGRADFRRVWEMADQAALAAVRRRAWTAPIEA